MFKDKAKQVTNLLALLNQISRLRNRLTPHLSRLQVIRDLRLLADLERRIYHNRLLRLAREGAQTAVDQLKEYSQSRRYATLVAIVLEAVATLTDKTLDLHDRPIGRSFAKSKSKDGQQFVEAAPVLQETLSHSAGLGGSETSPKRLHMIWTITSRTGSPLMAQVVAAAK